jgi:hypothetical protein
MRWAAAALLAVVLAGCSTAEPPLPESTSPDAVHAMLTGSDGAAKLRDVSAYDWPDEGAKPAGYFTWIGPDAGSADDQTATRAGESARVIADVLAANRDDLESVSPKLLDAYSGALVPYQGAMVGDPAGVRGFGSALELAAARNVFAVIGTDDFAEKAHARGLQIAAEAAGKACKDTSLADSVATPAIRSAAYLFGLARSVREPVGQQQSIDQMTRAMAEACLGVAGVPAEGTIRNFVTDGKLIAPEQTFATGTTEAYYQSTLDYLAVMGIDTGGYDDWYDEAWGQSPDVPR